MGTFISETGITLKGLERIWTSTELGKSGKHIAAEVWMHLKHQGYVPRHLESPGSRDIGRRVSLMWGSAKVKGVLEGYGYGGAQAEVLGSDGRKYIVSSPRVTLL